MLREANRPGSFDRAPHASCHAPRLADRHLLAQTIELPRDLGEICAFGKGDIGQQAARNRTFDVVRRVSVVVGIEDTNAELVDQGSDAVLTGADPFSANLDDVSAANRHVERTPPNPFARFENEKRVYPMSWSSRPAIRPESPPPMMITFTCRAAERPSSIVAARTKPGAPREAAAAAPPLTRTNRLRLNRSLMAPCTPLRLRAKRRSPADRRTEPHRPPPA